jgi:hypothetical protein
LGFAQTFPQINRWTPSGTFKIDYTTRDGQINGYYEVRFAPDGKTASGSVQELTGPKRSGSTNWTRIDQPGNQSNGQTFAYWYDPAKSITHICR